MPVSKHTPMFYMRIGEAIQKIQEVEALIGHLVLEVEPIDSVMRYGLPPDAEQELRDSDPEGYKSYLHDTNKHWEKLQKRTLGYRIKLLDNFGRNEKHPHDKVTIRERVGEKHFDTIIENLKKYKEMRDKIAHEWEAIPEFKDDEQARNYLAKFNRVSEKVIYHLDRLREMYRIFENLETGERHDEQPSINTLADPDLLD